MINRLKKVLLSIQLFSALVIMLPLYGYQVAPANAVIDSCLNRKGLEFLWVFPRQSGKDETIAHLCTFLLTLFHRLEACIVHVYPTSQQITVGSTRLERRMDNNWTAGRWWTKTKPMRRGIGQAVVAFFSGHPQARSEGATANLLLIINETQDQHEPTIDRRFTPMRASTNATALYVGTVRTAHDLLWKLKTRLERLQQEDGIQRVFMVTPDQVGKENTHYAAFVANQIQTKGRQHPSVKTELFNEPLDAIAGLFPSRRLALMRGTHERETQPQAGETYVITIDVGGQDEAATSIIDPTPDLQSPGRDYTVATVARVVRRSPANGEREIRPFGHTYQIVDVFTDHGSRHFQRSPGPSGTSPGQPSLFDRLLAYINHWKPLAVVCDASGVGQGITDALINASAIQIIGFDFAKSHGKAKLGNNFLALVETGRLKYFAGHPADPDAEGTDTYWYFTQCEHCSYHLAEGTPIERGLQWGVPPEATITLADGTTEPIHDDRLLSAALLAEADRLAQTGDIFLGTTASAVIPRTPAKDKAW